jgi:hypothetical protein
MAELSVSKVYENEIVKHVDFDYSFEQVLKNVEILGGLLRHREETDYVVGGRVSVSSDVVRSVMVSPLLCLGVSLNTPIYNPDKVKPVAVSASDTEADRVDIIQVQSVIEPYKPVQRKFYDPFLDAEKNMIKDLLPGAAGKQGRMAHDNRRFINAVSWIIRTGVPDISIPPAGKSSVCIFPVAVFRR